MGHIEQRTGRISLNSHVLGSGQPSKGDESTGLGNLRLVIVYEIISVARVMAEQNQRHTMCCKIGYASDRIALHLHVGTKHLTYERLEPAQLDNEQLVLS